MCNECWCDKMEAKVIRTKIFGKFKFIEFTNEMYNDIEKYLRAGKFQFLNKIRTRFLIFFLFQR